MHPLRISLAFLLLAAAPSPAAMLTVTNWGSADLFGSFSSLAAPLALVDNFCIGSHSGTYTITLQSANASGGAFHLASGAARMAYLVEFASAGSNFTRMSPSAALSNSTAIKNCSARSANVALRLTLIPADFNAAPVGVYSDTLTAIISDL